MTLSELIVKENSLIENELDRLQERVDELKSRIDSLISYRNNPDTIDREHFNRISNVDSLVGTPDFEKAYILIGNYRRFANQPQTIKAKEYLIKVINDCIENYSQEISENYKRISINREKLFDPILTNRILEYNPGEYFDPEEIEMIVRFLEGKEIDDEIVEFFIEMAKNNYNRELEMNRVKTEEVSKDFLSPNDFIREAQESGMLMSEKQLEQIDSERRAAEEIEDTVDQGLLDEKARFLKEYKDFIENEELKTSNPNIYNFIFKKLKGIDKELGEMSISRFSDVVSKYNNYYEFFKYRILDATAGSDINEIVSNIQNMVKTQSLDISDYFEIDGKKTELEILEKTKDIIDNYRYDDRVKWIFVVNMDRRYKEIENIVMGNLKISKIDELKLRGIFIELQNLINSYDIITEVEKYINSKTNEPTEASISLTKILNEMQFVINNESVEENAKVKLSYEFIRRLNETAVSASIVKKEEDAFKINSLDALYNSEEPCNHFVLLDKDLIQSDLDSFIGSKEEKKAAYQGMIQTLYNLSTIHEEEVELVRDSNGEKNKRGIYESKAGEFRIGWIKMGVAQDDTSVYLILGIRKDSSEFIPRHKEYREIFKELYNEIHSINNINDYEEVRNGLEYYDQLVREYNILFGGQVL